MTERTLIVLLSLIFLGSFIARNLIVKLKVQETIRAVDPLLTASMIFTTICIFITIFSTSSDEFYSFLGAVFFLRTPTISVFGSLLFASSILAGWFVSAQLKESWRIGVHENQKTDLIKSGVYKYVRNPYFVSYFTMFLGQFLVRPSIVLATAIAITVTIFHRIILKEEAYLLALHGAEYEYYRNLTGRYLPRFVAADQK